MTTIVPSGSVSIGTLIDRIEAVKLNPTLVISAAFDYLDEITAGEINIVDPTTPFVTALEMSAVNTAVAIGETKASLRLQYASLAQTPDELYMHMSDKDFVDRFASPATTTFTFVFLVSDLLNKLVYDPEEDCFKGIIARDTYITADDITFTMQYPIVIRRYQDGAVKIMYDATVDSPIRELTSNVMEPIVRTDSNGVDWAFLEVPMMQYSTITSYFPIQYGVILNEMLMFEDDFFYARVYNKSNSTGNMWKELKTTHTDQVFDPTVPTVVLKVTDKHLNVFVPPVYVTTEQITGEVRIDIYQTKGQLNHNFASYLPTAYDVKLKAIDEVRDVSDYSNIIGQLTYYVYNPNFVSGGKGWVPFEVLRERVINNSVGERNVPITDVNIQAEVEDLGFGLVKDVDIVTNRVYLAAQKLPKPLNKQLITPANMGVATLTASFDQLTSLGYVRHNENRLTIMSSNLYLNVNGQVSMLTPEEIEKLKLMAPSDLVNKVNSSKYLYTPFYYVLDSSKNEFEVRAYSLDYPVASNLAFESQNETLQLQVNTGKYFLTKTAQGYDLTIVTKSGNHYKNLPDASVMAQLGYYSVGENTLAYINGTYIGLTDTNERIYKFPIVTNYDIDADGNFCVTNGRMLTDDAIKTWVSLSTEFYIFHTTNSIPPNFVPDKANDLLGSFALPEGSVCVTYEKLKMKFGDSLKHLWTRSRTLPTTYAYEHYEEDVPLFYDRDIYDTDPVTGSIFKIENGVLVYLIKHKAGDPVLNDAGEQVYLHRKGDVKLSATGSPILTSSTAVTKEFDLLFVDGKYWFCNDKSFVTYRDELVATLVTWITQSLQNLHERLLEQTRLYFYPKTTLGMIKVQESALMTKYIDAEQTLTLDLYVSDNVHKDLDLRTKLRNSAIALLDDRITGKVIKIDDIQRDLKALFKDSVISLRLSNLGGPANNYNMLTVVEDHTRLCLKKNLTALPDGRLIIEEDVEVLFHNAERAI